VKADHRLDVRTGSGQFEAHRAAEAKPNGRHFGRIDLGSAHQCPHCAARPGARLGRIGIEGIEHFDRCPAILHDSGIAMEITREGHVTQRRQPFGSSQRVLVQAIGFWVNQHSCRTFAGLEEQFAFHRQSVRLIGQGFASHQSLHAPANRRLS
jgi:hypothetical protein